MNIAPPRIRACSPFRTAATRNAASPTAALAQAIEAGPTDVTRLSPTAGSFDPPTAAVLSSWREA